MTTMIGLGLLSLIVATLAVFIAAWRWLTKPAISDETVEEMWNVIAELHEAVYRLEMIVARLERIQAAGNGKHIRAYGGEGR
ncbi:MAG: hypothetical protein ACUVTP_03670 [Candidatus Fervidibacter sp.]|uniref:hypothetical protein n=1 Tax=Candidatus Fervidibacter sp. TaxID=3100871 RepID=UPI004049BA10